MSVPTASVSDLLAEINSTNRATIALQPRDRINASRVLLKSPANLVHDISSIALPEGTLIAAIPVGAATPVQLGGPVPGLHKDGKDSEDGEHQPKSKDAMTAKATSDAVAFIRGLAELRVRNADRAEKAVREAASLSAAKAFGLTIPPSLLIRAEVIE